MGLNFVLGLIFQFWDQEVTAENTSGNVCNDSDLHPVVRGPLITHDPLPCTMLNWQ
jgi:hypothetical protein